VAGLIIAIQKRKFVVYFVFILTPICRCLNNGDMVGPETRRPDILKMYISKSNTNVRSDGVPGNE
jgi:hypothetical protein